MDSTKPASRSTRRCLDTIGCGMPSCRSISPTDCWDETSRLNIARRFGSAMISNTDSIPLVYSTEHIRVKVYKGRGPRQRFQSACGDAPSDAFLAGAVQSAARSGRRGDERNSAVAFVPGSRLLASTAIVTASAFVGTNPTDKPIASSLPVMGPQPAWGQLLPSLEARRFFRQGRSKFKRSFYLIPSRFVLWLST